MNTDKINSEILKKSYDLSHTNAHFSIIHDLVIKNSLSNPDPEFFSGYRIYIPDIPTLELKDFLKFLSEKFNMSDIMNTSFGYIEIKDSKNISPPSSIIQEYEDEHAEDEDDVEIKRYIYSKERPNKVLEIAISLDDKKEIIRKYQEVYLYNFSQEEYLTLIKYFEDLMNKSSSKRKQSKINLILKGQNGFYSRKFPIKRLKINLNTYYGEGFNDKHKKIVKSLSDNNSGLYLIHGHKGTGKTSYLRYLTSLINKNFFLITKDFVPYLSDPSCLHYIITECANSIIIVEDAEEIIKPREENHSGNATSLILNMGDGMLSDVVNCKFILTFNTDIKNIDDAITRPGRLKIQHEFKKLTPEYANKVAKELKLNDVEFTEATALSDIFNYQDLNDIQIPTKSKNKIGF
jgi:hypothetical protein